LFYDSQVRGATLAEGLQKALAEAIAKLPIPKVMTYQLTDGWTDVKFVRPAHSLLALHGSDVVPVQALGLTAGNTTRGHRFEAAQPVVTLTHADAYAETLARDGAVIASFEARRAEIARQLAAAAAKVGGGVRPIDDDALLDEVTALVERPNVLLCQFEKQFLDVPQECLILTMKANQKYFPLLDASGRLTHQFLVVSNICPADASAVVGGNERVVRPRLADAKFFFDQDRKKSLTSRVAGLAKVVYHNKLGTQGERTERVRALARLIGAQLGDDALAQHADQAAHLAKADLLTDMVGEFPELQGIMGRYYAQADGLSAEIADAIEDHYKPRFAGDALPRHATGLVVALADKLETLAGLFAIGQLPTGDKDPFALRRHALGIVRMLMERDLPLALGELLGSAMALFPQAAPEALGQLSTFVYERLAGLLREQGYSAQEVDAVLALQPQRLGDVAKRLAAVRAFAALPEAPALAAANKRIANILKKAERADAHVNPALLQEDAEKALHAAVGQLVPQADAKFQAGDYTGSLQMLAALRAPVDAFFDGVMVNAEEADLRLNRLGLLALLHRAMNRVADLSRLAA
jgi:glycyl-tRNA synthetase beta chain